MCQTKWMMAGGKVCYTTNTEWDIEQVFTLI